MATKPVHPRADGEGTLGTAVRRWLTLYLSGDLSDGTNEKSVQEIVDHIDAANPHSGHVDKSGDSMTGSLRLDGTKLCLDDDSDQDTYIEKDSNGNIILCKEGTYIFAFETPYGDVQSDGDRYIYVDDSSNADDTNMGTSSDPLATIQAAWSSCPALVTQPIKVSIGAGTFSEALELSGKQMASSDAEIIIEGTLTEEESEVTADIFSTTTIGKVGSGWTPSDYVGMLVKITSGTGAGQEKIIVDNTADTLSVAYLWETTPDGTSKFAIYDFETIISPGAGNKGVLLTYQSKVTLKWLKFDAGAYGVYSQSASAGNTIFSCNFDSQTNMGVWVGEGSTVTIQGCNVDATGRGIVFDASFGWIKDCWVHDCGSAAGIHSVAGVFHMQRNYVNSNNNKGVYIQRNGVVSFWKAGNANFIADHDSAGDYGVYADMGGVGMDASQQVFGSSPDHNDEDYGADATSFAYVS